MIKSSYIPVRLYAWCVFWSVLVVLGLFLGLWQWERADDKRELLAIRESATTLVEPTQTPEEGSEVHLRGIYLDQHTLYLDNRIVEGRLGVAVLTPLRDTEGQLWLVQRGFIETGASRAPPSVSTPQGVVEVSGEWQAAHARGQLYGINQEGVRLQQLSLDPWTASLGSFSHDGWLHAESGSGVFIPWWEANVMPPSRHLGYAFQWWGLALAAGVIMLLGGYRLVKDWRENDIGGF
ncbi:SURF1 family protein [Vreelandella venusta]